MDAQACVMYVTCSTMEEAQQIARTLVTERLAACVSLMSGVTSIYEWEGQLQQEPEVILMIKTVESRIVGLTERVKKLHSYTVPEVISLPIIGGSEDYLGWLKSSLL